MDKKLLRKDFDKEQIKERKGKQNMTYKYVKTQEVIDRLNQSCETVEIRVIDKIKEETEVIVLISLVLDGQEKQAYGNALINNSVGDALKSASSDGIKKAAWLHGVPCIFNTSIEDSSINNLLDNQEGNAGFRCSTCNRTITKQVYNYSINKFNKPLCIQHQRRFTEEDMVV